MSEADEVKGANKVNGAWDKVKNCDSKELKPPKNLVSDFTIPASVVEASQSKVVLNESDNEKKKNELQNTILNSTLNVNAAEFIPQSNQNVNNIIYQDQCEEDGITYLKEGLKYLILNPGRYDEVVELLYEVIEPFKADENALQTFVSIIIEECISEPNIRYSGARICRDLNEKLGDKFRRILLSRCQEEYGGILQNTYSHDGNYMERIQGFCMLLAELFLHIRIKKNCITALGEGLLKILQKILISETEKGIKAVCQVLKLTGSKLEKLPNSKFELNELFNRLKFICDNYVDLDPNLKFIVTKVLDMRAKNWGENSEEEDSDSQSNKVSENQKESEYNNGPVLFGPDGKVISEEETSFLQDCLPFSESEDEVCDENEYNCEEAIKNINFE